jgi:hypothetical protein
LVAALTSSTAATKSAATSAESAAAEAAAAEAGSAAETIRARGAAATKSTECATASTHGRSIG